MFDLGPSWQEILDYWFKDGMAQGWPSDNMAKRWFAATAGDDADIEHRFGVLVDAALQQELVDWERTPQGRLALILLLDQFTRTRVSVKWLMPCVKRGWNSPKRKSPCTRPRKRKWMPIRQKPYRK